MLERCAQPLRRQPLLNGRLVRRVQSAPHQLARAIERAGSLREALLRQHHAADPLVPRPAGGRREAAKLGEQPLLARRALGLHHGDQVRVRRVAVHVQPPHARRAAVEVLERLGVHPLAVGQLEAALRPPEHVD